MDNIKTTVTLSDKVDFKKHNFYDGKSETSDKENESRSLLLCDYYLIL